MILIKAMALAAALLTAPSPVQDDPQAATVRRLASTALLAAQEYAIGVQGGEIVLAAEVDEAKLFLAEARRSTSGLPLEERERVAASLDSVIALVNATASPDSVSRRVRLITEGLSTRLGITLDEMPVGTPLLARGAEVYRAACASCHGNSGLGDGPAGVGLDPPPANLADAALLRDASPLDFYRRITIGVAGTAMPSFETALPADDRWAVAVYSTLLRLPQPAGSVPDSLRAFASTAKHSDAVLLAALGAQNVPSDSDMARLAAVRSAGTDGPSAGAAAEIFALVRRQVDSAVALAAAGRSEAAGSLALDAYITFEAVERTVSAQDPALAAELEAAFAELRARAGAGGGVDLGPAHAAVGAGLVRAERVFGAPMSAAALFTQSFILLLREGLEAILIVGALLTFLVKTGAGARRRDIHVGVGAALVASILTAVLIETIFHISPASQETLEGVTMVVATVVLFYVSYWLLSKLEVGKWTHFVRSRVQDAVTSGSALALASAAFLAVYREGFETILFYKALFAAGGDGATTPIMSGMLAGTLALAVVYVAISRFGVRLPLKPFFGITSAFLYAMAFIFAGKGIAELQAGRIVSTTYVPWAPNIPALGIFPTMETLLAQGILVALAIVALVWTFGLAPRRPGTSEEPDLAPVPVPVPVPAEVERIRRPLVSGAPGAESVESR